MNSIFKVINKSERIIVGALSGTSMDGVDVVLTKISGSGSNVEVKIIDFYTNNYPTELKKTVMESTSNQTSNVESICKLNFFLGHFFAESINKLISKNNLKAEDVDLIGSHGQTIYHIPVENHLLNLKTKSTLQIGDPSVIANLTGITTIGDFRAADVAAGGDGAPLVPYLDYVLFNSDSENRILVNIGGISNITFLRKSGKINDVIAFDTGPGNVLIDSLMKIFYNSDYDENGDVANSGILNKDLFEYIHGLDSFINVIPPKSTGREYYNREFIDKIIKFSKNIPENDIIKTVTEYTAFSIFTNIITFIKSETDNIFVSGGGAFNKCIMKSLSQYFEGITVQNINNKGITPENKEAVLFAVLANETIMGNETNIMSVTNAKKNVILGKICLAN